MKKGIPQVDLISVIVPVYNVEKYLQECLDSLVNQTYKNIEIILIDDGSTDRSGQICDIYSINHFNFTVIHKKNAGLGMARNTGLEVAQGKYVYFIDSDDYIQDDEIECLYNIIESNGVDACFTGYISIDDKKKIHLTKQYEDEVFVGDKAKTDTLVRMLGSRPDGSQRIEMSAAGQMYSLKVIKKNNIRFVSERKLVSEDLVFNWDFLSHANGACTTSHVGSYYRINPKSLSRQYRNNRFEQTKIFYEYVMNRLIQENYETDAKLRATKDFFNGIRHCIKQERLSSSYEGLEKLQYIRKICMDSILLDSIENYPINRLGIKQRLFLFFIRHKFSFLLLIFS